MPDLLRRLARPFAALLFAVGLVPAAGAITPDQLPPVDQVFVPSARFTDGAIEVRWTIAKGFYLYRHRTSVQADAGFDAGALQMPKGDAHHDIYFGDVETYRGALVATLPGTPRAARTLLTIKYQGCADAGVCYPPQTRTLGVDLPAPRAAAETTSLPVASPFARARAAATGGVDALPLPESEAFRFEAIAGDGNTLLLRFSPAPGYYLYRDRTTFALDAASRAAGFTLGAPGWPAARAHHDEHFGDVAVYFDPVDLRLPVARTTTAPRSVRVTARFQGCQTDGICYPPMTRAVEVALPAGSVGAVKVSAPPSAASSGDALAAVATAPGAATPASDAAAPVATPPMPDRQPPPAPRGVEPAGALSALLLALLGGLVLNLMPCVLPVLSLKALSLAESGSPGVARRHAFGYTAGVVVSFAALGGLALALRHAGRALGWGFQLQEPVVVAMLALVMFALGLSLSGLWYVGGRWIGAGHGLTTRSGIAGDFFTGVLAVVVATPCTAPFMGAALAWAFLAPAALAMAVFVALGLGLALPFILIGLLPGLARMLPRPGLWMETLKQALAFPLYLTAAWLLWVLGRQRGPDAIAWTLAAAVAIAFAAWAWSRSRDRARGWGVLALLVAVAGVGASLATVHRLPHPSAIAAPEAGRIAFDESRLAALRAQGRVVFVNITADWCVSCKANERTVLGRPAFTQALAAANAVYMVGDYTDVDPGLTAFLQRHGAVGVPLYVVYPRSGEPRVLPTLLTTSIVSQALADAAR